MENDLRKYELEQANEQIKMLHSFMPETFLRRGGERVNGRQYHNNYALQLMTISGLWITNYIFQHYHLAY